MTIATRDQLINALGNNNTQFVFDKASVASQISGAYASLWRATGQPGQGAIPGAAAVCDHTLAGAIPFTQQTGGATSYLAQLESSNGNANTLFEIHDRLMHMGGLSGTVVTAQTVNLDLNANLGTANLDARKGAANFRDVLWFMEWYTATGASVVNATVNVTYNDGTSADLSVVQLLASRPGGHMILLNSFIPAADSGKYIRDINSVTLSATTGTAGSFGFTATRMRGSIFLPVASPARYKEDWASLGLNEIFNSSCLFGVLLLSTASTGAHRAFGKIAHG